MKVSYIKRGSKFRVALPHTESAVKLLETSFNTLEIAALKKTWLFIEPKIKMLSKKIALDAYSEHSEWIELFRFDGKIENNSLIYHPLWILDIYGNTIKTNINTNYAIAKILEPIVEKYWHRFIPMPHLKDFLECVTNRLLNELQEHLSRTTQSGFEKLNRIILHFIAVQQKKAARFNVKA